MGFLSDSATWAASPFVDIEYGRQSCALLSYDYSYFSVGCRWPSLVSELRSNTAICRVDLCTSQAASMLHWTFLSLRDSVFGNYLKSLFHVLLNGQLDVSALRSPERL